MLWPPSNSSPWELVRLERYFSSCSIHCISAHSVETGPKATGAGSDASTCLPWAWPKQLSQRIIKDTKFFIFSALSQGTSSKKFSGSKTNSFISLDTIKKLLSFPRNWGYAFQVLVYLVRVMENAYRTSHVFPTYCHLCLVWNFLL